MDYYVNMGRWCPNVIGPFPNRDQADLYIEHLDWRGARPTVSAIAPPDPFRLAACQPRHELHLTVEQATAVAKALAPTTVDAGYAVYDSVYNFLRDQGVDLDDILND